MPTRKRGIAKTITFRISATIITAFLVWVFTGSLLLMGIIGGLEFISKLFLYYVHERVWNRVSWGRNV